MASSASFYCVQHFKLNGGASRLSLKYVIVSQTYQKRSGDVILSNSGRYCSVYKLQDKAKHGLITTTLIFSVSHFKLGLKLC